MKELRGEAMAFFHVFLLFGCGDTKGGAINIQYSSIYSVVASKKTSSLHSVLTLALCFQLAFSSSSGLFGLWRT